jgi:hypothetical protein
MAALEIVVDMSRTFLAELILADKTLFVDKTHE